MKKANKRVYENGGKGEILLRANIIKIALLLIIATIFSAAPLYAENKALQLNHRSTKSISKSSRGNNFNLVPSLAAPAVKVTPGNSFAPLMPKIKVSAPTIKTIAPSIPKLNNRITPVLIPIAKINSLKTVAPLVPRLDSFAPQALKINPAPVLKVTIPEINTFTPKLKQPAAQNINLIAPAKTALVPKLELTPKLSIAPRLSVTPKLSAATPKSAVLPQPNLVPKLSAAQKLSIASKIDIVPAPKINQPALKTEPVKIPVKKAQGIQLGRLQPIKIEKANLISKVNLSLQYKRVELPVKLAKLPTQGPAVPVYPSRQERQPLNLPPLPQAPAPANQSNTNSNSGNHNHGHNSNSAGAPSSSAVPLMLGMFGHFSSSLRQRMRKIITEITRRQQNGIGIIFAARSPNISRMNGCILATVHQFGQEDIYKAIFADKAIRSQKKCGLFCFIESLKS